VFSIIVRGITRRTLLKQFLHEQPARRGRGRGECRAPRTDELSTPLYSCSFLVYDPVSTPPRNMKLANFLPYYINF
jgi:hypothetical protein